MVDYLWGLWTKILMTVLVWAGSKLFENVDIRMEPNGIYVQAVQFYKS